VNARIRWPGITWVPLPWYQPVLRLHPLGTALAGDPIDQCVDGTTRQPIIAIRRYGRGEVIYFRFNETWRLRRKYGGSITASWGQMIHRLGLFARAGEPEAIVVRTDRQQYQPDDKVLVSVEAYNANYEPLAADDLPEHALDGRVDHTRRDRGRQADLSRLAIPLFREGGFRNAIERRGSGRTPSHRHDPVTHESRRHFSRWPMSRFDAAAPVRNTALAREICRWRTAAEL